MRHDRGMPDTSPAGPSPSELRVRLAAHPASVPGARRFVADALHTWGLEELVDDATLCVSELAGNAALHSASTFMEVAMRPAATAVRISVEDDGETPIEAVVPRATFAGGDEGTVLLEEQATTGRGLAIVSILASDWGVEETAAGKRVWLEINQTDAEHGVRPPTTTAGARAGGGASDTAPDRSAGPLPDGWAVVRLAGCPVQLSLRQDEHLDELIRELQLVAADQDNPRSLELASRLTGLLSAPAHARHTGRLVAQVAAEAGHERIDVDMAMPREFSAEVRKLQAAVREADVLCEEMRLLTLASSPDLSVLRDWMTEQVTEQLEQRAAPVSWEDWLARRG